MVNRIEEHRMEVDAPGMLTYRPRGEDPLTTEAKYQYRIHHARGNWNAVVECAIRVIDDVENFRVKGEFRAIKNRQVTNRRVVYVAVQQKFV